MLTRFSFHLLLVFLSLPSLAADWPQFLGPARDGVAAATEKALPDDLEIPSKPLWTLSLGSGHAGPVVAGGKVIVFHRQGSDVFIQALEAATGKPVWETRFPTSYRDGFGMDDGPRAVPTLAQDLVVVHGADGMIYALELATGKERWKVDTERDHDSQPGFFGRACAPLVVDGKVIVSTGGKAALTAFDVKNGSIVWATGDEAASYASPVMLNAKVMLAWLRDHLTTVRVEDGKVLSKEHLRPEIDASVSAATPIRTDLGWFVTAEYDVGASLWKVGGAGDLTKLWTEASLLNAHYATPVHHDGKVYGFDGRQERGMTLRCIDLTSKSVAWESPRVRGGTLLRVKDKLLVLTEEGELWIVSTSHEKFDLLASAQILRAGHRSYAAYSDGVYFARDAEKLVAIRLSPP
jgi:outer membrane protein assembly factor BamB